MATVAKLLVDRAAAQLTAEERAEEEAAVLAVQREMDEADEPNLLEEEDMHVFDQHPLTDPLILVACNLCKKPIKNSQFAAHWERCKSMHAQEDSAAELDGGAGPKKPQRKARKKLLSSQENQTGAGEPERLQSLEDDDLPDTAGTSSGGFEDQPPLYSSGARGTKKVMNISEGTVVSAPKVGRPRKAVVLAPGDGGAAVGPGHSDAQPPSKRPKILTTEELDSLCGVLNAQTGMMCRRSITCKLHAESSKRAVQGRRRPYDTLLQVFKANKLASAMGKPHDTVAVDPLPLATKVYCLRPQQRMRAVLGSLFRDACSRPAANRGNSPDRLSGELGGQVPPALTFQSDQSSDLQTGQLSGFNQKKSANQPATQSAKPRDKKAPPLQLMPMAHVKAEPGLAQAVDYTRMNITSMGLSGMSGYQHLENRLGMAGVPMDYGHLVMGKGRPIQGLPVGTNVPGVQGNQPQQSFGGVPVT